jgi:hypothetical protein
MFPWTITNPFGSLFVLLLWGCLVVGFLLWLQRRTSPARRPELLKDASPSGETRRTRRRPSAPSSEPKQDSPG